MSQEIKAALITGAFVIAAAVIGALIQRSRRRRAAGSSQAVGTSAKASDISFERIDQTGSGSVEQKVGEKAKAKRSMRFRNIRQEKK